MAGLLDDGDEEPGTWTARAARRPGGEHTWSDLATPASTVADEALEAMQDAGLALACTVRDVASTVRAVASRCAGEGLDSDPDDPDDGDRAARSRSRLVADVRQLVASLTDLGRGHHDVMAMMERRAPSARAREHAAELDGLALALRRAHGLEPAPPVGPSPSGGEE